ncbi:toprim domain-containing protein [Hymenobacter setariae]|uniref:Toprim domain-containing protein n=1 Tax=Hymenobacter setariae TaxID=2594794 RepID=A0A558BJU1_9BACT|nr:toprim domain-containing protein [Hymenobacter setariae]TVT36780.1 toprim domain-containing protein [Hymenobacter setariae]
MEHDLTFQQIKERVELPEILTHYGYALQKGEDLGKGKWHVFEGDDKLVVFKGRGGDWMYFNSQDDRDKGSVVDWMKNRVSTGRVVGIEQLPGRNMWQSVNDHFRAYLNLPESERPRLTLPPISETTPGEKFHSIYTKDCRPLENTTFLESRGITKTTIENPQFAGRILNQLHTVQREGMPAKTFVNTAFPAYHDGRVVGLELKGEGFKGQAAESQFARSLWLSKLPEGKPPTHLVVSESAIDTLSYAQLHPGERVLYASTSGTLTQNKIFEMKRLLGEERIPAIKSAFDNDTQGHHFDTRLLAGFASEQNPMKVVREHEHLLTVEVTTANLASMQAVTQQLKSFNARTTEQYNRESGEPVSPAIAQTLRDELISSARQGPNTYQFHVPMNREALGAFNQAIAQSLQYDQKIELVKSQGKDWNEDLKQDQMQRVVKRELGSAVTQQPEVPATARDKGERLLTIAYRESRDEMSQLSTLQQNLEKVGLSIDHSRKLDNAAPRELATELTLRYRLDSPQLPAISAALDSLATNPKVTVNEGMVAQTERRQMAGEQEVAQQQKRAEQQQLQPSDSPGHDQARRVFINAAALVAQTLRENGGGLQAAYLQQVSKSLLKQPEIKPLDQENLVKVLAKVDQVPALKDSSSVGQLRQAMQVLLTPAKQEQAQAQQPERRRGPKLS